MSIVTKTGDKGTTGLMYNRRVSKCHPRVEAYGAVDELNAAIGLAASVIDGELQSWLRQIQHELFNIGSHLATAAESPSAAKLPALDEAMIGRLEMQIDSAEGELPALKQFILPGGSESACRLHLARTICRRAERRIVSFSMDRPVQQVILTYLNRLSDWLFVMARLANHRAGVADIPWNK